MKSNNSVFVIKGISQKLMKCCCCGHKKLNYTVSVGPTEKFCKTLNLAKIDNAIVDCNLYVMTYTLGGIKKLKSQQILCLQLKVEGTHKNKNLL